LEQWVGVTWARNYDEAVAAFSNEVFSALITDVRLEGPSGFEVLAKFRQMYPRVPAMVLTAYFEEGDSIRACELGSQYVAKPITTLGLQRFIEEAKPAPLPLPPPSLGLSPAEQRIFGLLARRFSNTEVARTLGISVETVKSHVKAILAKLGVESRTEIPNYAGRGRTRIPL
jgi:DNA-binding NarL/FixJ family response regulator